MRSFPMSFRRRCRVVSKDLCPRSPSASGQRASMIDSTLTSRAPNEIMRLEQIQRFFLHFAAEYDGLVIDQKPESA